MLKPEAVHKYQLIYKKVYGKDIDYKTAEEQGKRLLNLVRVIFEDKNVVNSYLFHKRIKHEKS